MADYLSAIELGYETPVCATASARFAKKIYIVFIQILMFFPEY